MEQIKFDQQGFALTEGKVTVYNFHPITGEYQHSAEEFLTVGVGLPQYSSLSAPLAVREGFAVCYQDGQWCYQEDHRGKTAYRKQSQEQQAITEIGPLDEEFTLLPPSTPFDRWQQNSWVCDQAAQQQAEVDAAVQQQQQLETEANEVIARLMDAIELDIALEEDDQRLIEWRKYRVLLGRVDSNQAPNISWPEKPQ